MDWPVVFRTHSEIEASIVRGLLETHGIDTIPSTGPASSTIFPFNAQGLVEVCIAVPPDLSAEATRIIAEHRDTVPNGVVDNESLEFLGDAVLGFVIADLLYHEFPHFQEGQKSKAKAALVSTAALAALGQRIGLGDYLLLGRGEEKTGGRTKLALLADGCEAVIAAIYLDGGVEQARSFILRELSQEIDRVRSPLFLRDYKSALQERLQAEGRPLPEYDVAAERGPDHDKRFQVVVRVAGQVVAESEGRTKKEAEQEAARLALEILRDDARR